jgi:hypothetical protein
MLFYPEGFSELWARASGEQGQVFYFRWPPGRTAVQAVSMHNPEVCLSSIGMRKIRALDPAVITVRGETIPFRSWLFDQKGRPVYVFHALLEEGEREWGPGGLPDDSPAGRLKGVLSGHRNRGQRMVEIALWNMPGEDAARQALDAYLREVLSTPSSPTHSSP